MGFNELRPLVFRVTSTTEALPHTFVTLNLPAEMKSATRDAIASATNRDPRKVRLPIRVLNRAVRMLVPDLISIVRDADKEEKQTWLYGYGSVPASPFAMQQILRSWIWTALDKRVSVAIKQEIRQRISPDTLKWQPETVDLAHWKKADNETAIPYTKDGPQNSFVLLPDFLAARLSAPNVVFEWGVHRLHFRRAPMAPGSSGTELISWPPLRDEQAWPYSIVITLTLQTIPFQVFPQVHCAIGVRRWAGPPIQWLSGGRRQTSVYLLDTVPWIEGMHYSNSFQVAPISWRSKPIAERKEGESSYQLGWDTALVRLLDDLHPKSVFPDPQLLCANPNAYIQDFGSSAALVYRNGIEPAHEIGTGLMPRDRFLFAEQLERYLKPDLEFIHPLTRKSYRVIVPPNPFFTKAREGADTSSEDEREEPLAGTHAERRTALSRAVQRKFTLEIWYQSTIILQALLHAIQTLFGEHPNSGQADYTWTTPELELSIYTAPLGNRGDVLNIKPGSPETLYNRVRDAIRQRIDTMAPLPATKGYIGALIELDDAQMFGEDDPKSALRLAFAQHGRLTQFITPQAERKNLTDAQKRKEQTKLEQRALSAVRDLLRQTGTQGLLPRIVPYRTEKGLRIPESLHYLGVYLVKQNAESSPTHISQTLPIFVHMTSKASGIQVMAPGFRTWLEYPNALLALAGGQALGVRRPREAYQFILDTLGRCLPAFGDTLLFCQAQNMRGAWIWLQNELMTKMLPRELERYPQLRIVRIRNGVHETPEWYAQSEKNAYGLSGGLFAIGESGHVFASVQEKPPSAKNLSKDLSMVLSRVATNRKTKEEKIVEPDPSIMAWNPGLVEITVACADPSDALACAIVANELRHHFASHFAHPTVFPFPLHLAVQLGQYILPLEKAISSEDGEDFYPEDET